jgi:hypothetical protein
MSTSENIVEQANGLLRRLREGSDVTDGERIAMFRELVSTKLIKTYVHMLPLVMNLESQPYTLSDHFAFEPLFSTHLAPELTLKTGRQTGKSQSVAARGVMLCNAIPNFSLLYVTPLYEQIRRFSTQYVRPLVEQSPMKALWTSTHTENSVLQRSFTNGSKMYFSFAWLDADRLRGISAKGGVSIDEVQDMDSAHIPIIMETLSAAKDWGIKTFSGTPKTLDGTLEGCWSASSQAEWVMICPRCGKENIPAMGYDLDDMIGPFHPDISEERPGTICARCKRPISPRLGRWWHKYPELRMTAPGYHIPQIVMPMHYSKPLKWSHLLGKRNGAGNTTTAMFYNEVLGESYDIGTKLVNLPDLQAAAILPWRNVPDAPIEVLSRLRDYTLRILSVDWGGGGEKQVSFTTAAIIGVRPDGKLDVIYGRRLLTPHDHLREARELLSLFGQFECHLFAHDYTGAGDLRETFMIQVGLPLDRVAPVAYVGAARQGILIRKPATATRPRTYWQLDKTRSLVLTCSCIKLKRILFFQDDYQNKDNKGLLRDFLALIENKTETHGAGELYQIIRAASQSDDFAHAVNIGSCIAWEVTGTWPDLARDAGFSTSPGAMELGDPEDPWGDGSY